MDKARWNVADAPDQTSLPATTRCVMVASGKGGVGKSSVTVNLAAALAAAGFTVGVLDADIWGFSVPRMLGLEGRLDGGRGRRAAGSVPHEREVGAGRLRVVSMGFLVEDEERRSDVAGPHAQPGGAALPRGRRLGRRPRLPAHRHAARHRRRADGRGQAAAPRRDDRRHHAGARRPEGRHPGGRHGPQELPARRRRHREHERATSTTRRSTTCSVEAAATSSPPTRACRCSGASRSSPPSPRAATRDAPIALGDGPAAEAFRRIARVIVDEVVPPADMAGCSARMLGAMDAALAAAGS